MHIDEKINQAKNDDVNIENTKNENSLHPLHCGIC